MTIVKSKPVWISPTLKNRLVSELNIIDDRSIFESRAEIRHDKEYDISGVGAIERTDILDDSFYMPSTLSWQIYTAIAKMLKLNYRNKDISALSYYAAINQGILSKGRHSDDSSHQKTEMGGAIIGPSGLGKTKAVNRAISLFPSAIIHEAEHTEFGKAFLQIPCIKVNINARSSKGLLRDILREISKKSGVKYCDVTERTSETALIEMVANACLIFAIGVIVLDEAQAFVTGNTKNSGADSPNAKFLQRLFNSWSVPILLIGTPETDDFLSCNAHTYRRYKKNVDIVFDNYSEESEYWRELVKTIIQNYAFCKEVSISEDHFHQIYVYTAGNLSVLQIFCKELIQQVEDNNVTFMSNQLLTNVYEAKKSTMNELTRLHLKPITKEALKQARSPNKRQKKAEPENKAPDNVSEAEKRWQNLGQDVHDLFTRKV